MNTANQTAAAATAIIVSMEKALKAGFTAEEFFAATNNPENLQKLMNQASEIENRMAA